MVQGCMSVLHQQCQSRITVKIMVMHPPLGSEWKDNVSQLQYRQKVCYMGAGKRVCAVVLVSSLKENLVFNACMQ